MRSLRAIEHEGTWRLPATPDAVREMRVNVQRLLEQHRVDPGVRADIELAVSEAVANSVVHAYPGEPGPVEVRAEVLDGSIVVTVSDEGVGMSPRPDSPGLRIGLPLIGRLASAVDIRSPESGGSGVRMTFIVPELAGTDPVGRERDRTALLEEVRGLSESASWPQHDCEPLLEALVPRLADACAIDVLDDTGELERVGARVSGPGSEEIAALLAGRPLHRAALERTLASQSASVAGVGPETLDELAADERARELLERMEISWWVRLPLLNGGRPIGVLSLGLRASRPDPRDELPFLHELGRSVARGIARARLVAAVRDAGERFELILGRLTTAVTLRDREGKLLYANDAAVDLLGASTLEEALSSTGAVAQLAMRFAFALEDGSPVTLRHLPADRLRRGEDSSPVVIRSVERVSGRERWIAVRARMLDREGGLLASISEDVTEVKREQIRAALLAGAGGLGAPQASTEAALTGLSELVVPALADWACVHVREGGDLRLVAVSHQDPKRRARVRDLLTRWSPRLDAPGGIGEAIRSGEPQLHPYLTDDLLREYAWDAGHLRSLEELLLRSALCVPIALPDGGGAALSLVMADSWRRFDRRQLELARELAARTEKTLAGAHEGAGG